MKTQRETYELHRTLFSASVSNKVEPESIPIGNIEAVETLFKGMETLEFVNEVLLGEAHPAQERWEQVILTEEWAKSFAAAVNKKPGFLYAKGHEDAETWFSRAIASGYIVGAKVEGERLLLRNRLLERESPDNKELMHQTLNEIRAGLLSTSTGDYQKRKIVFSDDEPGEYKQYAIESIKNQTNALVEHDMHASDATIISSNFRLAYYKDNKLVYTSESNTIDSGVIKEQGEVSMDKHIEAIKSSMKSVDIAKAFGLEIVTDEVKETLTLFKDIESQVGDIKKFIKSTLEEREAVFKALKENALKEAFKEAEVYEAAESLFRIESGTKEEIATEITRLKELSGIKKMQSMIASSINSTPSSTEEVVTSANQDTEA